MKNFALILILLLAGGYAFFQHRKQENEKLLKLEKMRLEELRLEEQERQKKLDRQKRLKTHLAELKENVVKLTAEADECKNELDKLAGKQENRNEDINLSIDITRQKLDNYKQIKRDLENIVSEFKILNENTMIHCYNTCVPLSISFYRTHKSDGKIDAIGGFYVCARPYNHHEYEYGRWRGGKIYSYKTKCRVYFVCSNHKNRWTEETYQRYKDLRERWRNLKNDHRKNAAKLQHYEKLIKETEDKLSRLNDSKNGSDGKITVLSQKHRLLCEKIKQHQEEIERIQSQLDI